LSGENANCATGAQHGLLNVGLIECNIVGKISGTGPVNVLDPGLIFKGKLQACAMRDKPSDAVDVRFLESNFLEVIQRCRTECRIEDVAKALKRYPELHYPFSRIGFDLEAAYAKVKDIDLTPGRIQPGDVQKGLLLNR